MRSRRGKLSAVGEDVIERILAGAAVAFGKLGAAETRVEDILEAAKVSRPTFYKAFESKEDVFDTLSERHHRDIRERILRAIEGTPEPILQVERAIEAFMRWRAELGAVGRVLDVEARLPGSRLARHRARTLDEVVSLAAAGMQAAGRAPVDPVLYHGLIAALERVADTLLARHPVTEAAIQRACANAFRIVGGALAGPADAVPPLPGPPSSTG